MLNERIPIRPLVGPIIPSTSLAVPLPICSKGSQNLVMSSASGQQIGGDAIELFASEAVVAAVAALSVRPEMVR